MAVCGVGVTEPSLLDACLEARLLNLQPAGPETCCNSAKVQVKLVMFYGRLRRVGFHRIAEAAGLHGSKV